MVLRVLFLLAALALGAAIVWASFGPTGLLDAVGIVARERWGTVMLVDLYAGFLAAAAIFFLVERPLVAVALVIALMILGNVVTLVWLAVRGWTVLSRALGRAG